jgi:hypothetical protein
MGFKFYRAPTIARVLSVLVAAIVVMVLSLGSSDANAAKRKPVVQASGPNYSYQSGPRTRVFVSRRSWLDPGTEVLPGERKFTDYAYAPGYNYGRNIDRLNQGRNPLSDNFDIGGAPTRFPLY